MSSYASQKSSSWTKRMERAALLAEQSPWARELLGFYWHILQFQKSVYDAIIPASRGNGANQHPLRDSLNLEDATRHFGEALRNVQQHGPPKLRAEAEALATTTPEQFREALELVVSAPQAGDQPIHFLARVVLQPYAERLAEARDFTIVDSATSQCPNCGGDPQLAIIRPEGDGGKRSLLCSFCQTEWEYRRILCPKCGEQHNQKLPRYSAENAASVRVEACDTCKAYIKSFDLTVDGFALPMVDEIATAPLDLWAADHGYTKLHLNILGF